MGEEEWASGQVVQHVGGQDGSWLFLFPFSRVRFLLFFLPGAMETVIYKTATADCFGSGGAAAMALRARHVAGYQIQDYTHTLAPSIARHLVFLQNERPPLRAPQQSARTVLYC